MPHLFTHHPPREAFAIARPAVRRGANTLGAADYAVPIRLPSQPWPRGDRPEAAHPKALL